MGYTQQHWSPLWALWARKRVYTVQSSLPGQERSVCVYDPTACTPFHMNMNTEPPILCSYRRLYSCQSGAWSSRLAEQPSPGCAGVARFPWQSSRCSHGCFSCLPSVTLVRQFCGRWTWHLLGRCLVAGVCRAEVLYLMYLRSYLQASTSTH